MKNILFSLFFVLLSQFAWSQQTTYFLIRHTEKELAPLDKSNPNLTEQGRERAQHWNMVFHYIEFDAIYSTDYIRTIETARPIAEAQNLEIKSYNPQTLFDSDFQQATLGKTVLVVGHSNTTPVLANRMLKEERYPLFDDSEYDSFFVVTISNEQTIVNKLAAPMN